MEEGGVCVREIEAERAECQEFPISKSGLLVSTRRDIPCCCLPEAGESMVGSCFGRGAVQSWSGCTAS